MAICTILDENSNKNNRERILIHSENILGVSLYPTWAAVRTNTAKNWLLQFHHAAIDEDISGIWRRIVINHETYSHSLRV
jgi:hypothetical protein